MSWTIRDERTMTTHAFDALTPEHLLREIAYYRRKAEELAHMEDPREQGMRHVYQTLASDRVKLLAALKDGHPEAWTDYPA